MATPSPAPSPTVTVFVVGLGQPGPFDWLTGLVVPVLAGLASVAVAIAAWRATTAANALTALRLEEEQRKERARLVPHFRDWLYGQTYFGHLPTVNAQGKRQAEWRRRIEDDLRSRPDNTGVALMGWLDQQVKAIGKPGPSDVHARALRNGESFIDRWVLDPNAVYEEISREGATLVATDT